MAAQERYRINQQHCTAITNWRIKDMENKLVSLVVTCYNLQDKIGRCLESLTSQTYPHLEIIVIDDGSKDGSFSVIQAAASADPRIRAVHQENAGVSASRNHGIDLATGEYLMFIDGDDYVANTFVEHYIEVADGCDMVIGGMRMVYPDGQEKAILQEIPFRCDIHTYVAEHYTRGVINRTLYGPVHKLFRTAVLQNNHVRFREELEIREDGIFVLDALVHCETLCGIEYAEYYYVQSPPGASLVTKFHPNEKDINKLFNDIQVSVIGRENMTAEHIRLFHTSLLSMDFGSIRKFYYSPDYSFMKGIRYIRSILKDNHFRKIRKELKAVDPGLARKYYRPVWMVHFVNLLAVKLKK